MKRLEGMSDKQWNAAMELRKQIASRRMAASDDRQDSINGFFTLAEINKAAYILFGVCNNDTTCKAENWLAGKYEGGLNDQPA